MPHGCVSEGVAKLLRNFIGSFLEYDGKALPLRFSRFMSVRVRVDVRNPLKRKKKLGLSNGSFTYVTFAYEKVTLFCFLCGKLGHEESYCTSQILQVIKTYCSGGTFYYLLQLEEDRCRRADV